MSSANNKLLPNILPELDGPEGGGVVAEEVDGCGSAAASGGGGCEAAEGVVVVGPDMKGFPIATRLWIRSATAAASCCTVASGNRGATGGTGADVGATATGGTGSSDELEDDELIALNCAC